MGKKALIIFTRNPELGKCKTRLAKTLGDKSTLDIYNHLLRHTAKVSKEVEASRYVFYSETINHYDIWDSNTYYKKLQKGEDLGERMKNAFSELFKSGYQKAIIIGSDLLDLNASLIEKAFRELDHNDVVIGPAEDGGYYLLGSKKIHSSIFENKKWGTETVRMATLKDLENSNVHLLKVLNDIDTFEDMNHYEELKKYH